MASGQNFPEKGRVVNAANDTVDLTGQFFGFQVYTNTVISAITATPGFDGVENLVGLTLPPGIYQLRFRSIRFSSGIVMLFGEV